MTNNLNSWFTFAALEKGETDDTAMPDHCAVFTIERKEVPEIMTACGANGGYYLGQIGWLLVATSADGSAPYEIIIDFCGNVNPGYNAATRSLYGDEVGGTLLMESETYQSARSQNYELLDTYIDRQSEQSREGETSDEMSPYLSDVVIIDSIITQLVDESFAEHVLNRLLANSVFV